MLRSVLRRLVFAAIVAAATGCSAGAGRQLISTGISSYDRQTILDAHNHLRQSVALGRVPGQPGAANMMQMVWDDELAAKAQHWADSCAHGHDPGRHVARFKVGQNIARSWTWPRPDSLGGTSEFARQIQNWFNEVSGYRYRGASAAGTGHYSQLIWGDSYLVGCGYSYFLDPTQGYTKLYVCNYGPGGNIRGYTPYQSGSPSCESFGWSPSTEYSGLCYPPGHSNTYGSHSSLDIFGSNSVGSQGYHVGTHSYSVGSHNYNLGNQGYNVGNQGYNVGNQGYNVGSQGYSVGSHGYNVGSQGYNVGSQGYNVGSHDYNVGSHSYNVDSQSFGSSSLDSHNLGYSSSFFGSSGFDNNGFDNNIFGGSRGYWK